MYKNYGKDTRNKIKGCIENIHSRRSLSIMRQLETYMAKRFRIGPQRIIHWGEMAIVESFLDLAGGKFGKILDCPCGYGRLTEVLSRRSEILYSSDISPHKVAVHANFFSEPKIKLLNAASNITRLPFKERVFDGTVTFRLFHHLDNKEVRTAIFREAARVTDKFLILSFYRKNVLHEMSRSFNMNSSIRKRKIVLIEADIIRQEAEQAGWKLIECSKVLPGIHAQTIALFMKP